VYSFATPKKENMPVRRVVLVIVPPIRLLKAMLMFWMLPFRLREKLSNISGISLATGARKKANRMGFTLKADAASTTESMKGLLHVQMSRPPTKRYNTPL